MKDMLYFDTKRVKKFGKNHFRIHFLYISLCNPAAVYSCKTNRVLCTRMQVQRRKHWPDHLASESVVGRRAFAFSACGRKFKPPASRVVVDSVQCPRGNDDVME